MPFPATPAFRFSRTSTRRNAGPQFASTPRFLLSQSATQNENDDHDVIDDTDATPVRQAAYNPPVSQAAVRSRQRDVIDDSDNAEPIRDRPVGSDRNELPDDAIDSTPPEEPGSPGVLEAEFDALFAPTGDGNKRRRMERGTPSASTKLAQLEPISSSPPGTADAVTAIDTPDIRRQSATIWEATTQRTPAPPARPIPPSTPSDMRTPFRGRPRFMLSSTMKPPGSQSAPKFKPNTPTISPPERRKPTFVLPRSPSPKPGAEDIPAPFSPSSRTLSRRGRNRGGATKYVPGGMAAEVRSWVLEMGAKREQLPKASLTHSSGSEGTSEEMNKYLLAARVISVSHSTLNGCGSVAFLQARAVSGQKHATDSGDTLNLLIMGPPRSKPDACQGSSDPDTPVVIPLQGDLIGIHPGLTWTLRLGAFSGQIRTKVDSPDTNIAVDSLEDGESKEPWLVAMEWDLVERHVDS